MINSNFLRILIIFLSITLLGSCKKNTDNFDIDFINLKKPQKINIKNKKEIKEKNEEKNNIFLKKLVAFKDPEQVLSKTKFGKKDPFSVGEIQFNKLNSNFEIKGFLNTQLNKYVFVNYLNNEGTITEDSIGGINTNLLPNGAKVINIDSKNMRLTIFFENENFIFEL